MIFPLPSLTVIDAPTIGPSPTLPPKVKLDGVTGAGSLDPPPPPPQAVRSSIKAVMAMALVV